MLKDPVYTGFVYSRDRIEVEFNFADEFDEDFNAVRLMRGHRANNNPNSEIAISAANRSCVFHASASVGAFLFLREVYMKGHCRKVIGAAGLSLALCMGSFAGYAADFTVVNDAPDVRLETSRRLPLRYTAENCGYTVTWNEDESIALEKDGLKIRVKIGSDNILVNDEEVNLHYTPYLIGGKTYLPYDFYTGFFADKYITKTAENTYSLADKPPVSADSMMKTVEDISQIPRHPTDATHEGAIEYVTNKFEEYGYNVERQEFEYEAINWNTGTSGTVSGANLIAVKKADLEPTGDVLILGAHYDGVAGMPAANDNGSGLSVLLELARVLKDLPSDTEIRFVAFDAEEDGLCGSKEYVKQLTDTDKIIGMLNFDMLGGAKAGKVEIHTADEQDCYLIDILRRNYEFSDVVRQPHPGGGSDYMSFPSRLIPAVDFSHASIHEEYHNENDLPEYVSADMLEYAAKGGEAITTAIMSNLTPLSYQDIAKPRDNNFVFEITPETYIPAQGTIEKIQRIVGAKPIQIESDDSDLKYQIHIKLFDLAKPLNLIYDAQAGSAYLLSPYIDLTDSGISYEDIKALLDEKIGGGVKIQGDEYGCQYNSVYGNRFNLYYNSELEERRLLISIGDYFDNDGEAYAVEDGELVRMDGADLETVYEITKTKGGVSVTETAPKPSRALEVSDRARRCWERIKPLLTAEELKELSYFVLESDGFGKSVMVYGGSSDALVVGTSFAGEENVEIPEEYKSLPKGVQSYVKYILTQEEGAGTSFIIPLSGKMLRADCSDLLDERGAAYSDTNLIKACAVMKGLDLFSEKNFLDSDAEYPENGTTFEKQTYSVKRGSVVYDFAERFYREIFGDKYYYLYDLYGKYPGNYVCEEAANSIVSDMAYSFAEFVVRDKPAGDSVIERKIKFFYDYPEYAAVRKQLRQSAEF